VKQAKKMVWPSLTVQGNFFSFAGNPELLLNIHTQILPVRNFLFRESETFSPSKRSNSSETTDFLWTEAAGRSQDGCFFKRLHGRWHWFPLTQH
jgi:hypothetical protein